jgi:hypothetical protein
MKKIVPILLFMHFANASLCQENDLQFALRLPIQYDLQRAEIPFSFGTEVQKAEAINFGIEALINYKIRKASIYTGVGFFRNRFNIKRGYDHQALNIGRDSLPIGTSTKNYTYSLLRLPLGFNLEILQIKNTRIGIGAEHFFNFSFRRKYNGAVPFEGANTVYNGVNYFGNSFNFFINLTRSLQKSKSIVEIEPYVRIYNNYKKDRFLKEKENENVVRSMDAFGVGIRYYFTL